MVSRTETNTYPEANNRFSTFQGIFYSPPPLTLLKVPLNSSTIDKLGSWCLEGCWNQAEIRHGEGGIHGNPVSGHHQQHRHTESNQWNTYQTQYLPKGGWRGGLKNKASKMTYLAGQQATKCDANHGAPPSRELKGRP